METLSSICATFSVCLKLCQKSREPKFLTVGRGSCRYVKGKDSTAMSSMVLDLQPQEFVQGIPWHVHLNQGKTSAVVLRAADQRLWWGFLGLLPLPASKCAGHVPESLMQSWVKLARNTTFRARAPAVWRWGEALGAVLCQLSVMESWEYGQSPKK